MAPSTAAEPPEILAPAGDWDCLRAAVSAGADAVYFGLTEFSARGRAANFSPRELPAVMQHLHDRNVRGYAAVNTLLFPEELDRAAELLRLIAAAGVDAVIVQDLGLAALVRRMFPTLPIHASTQMTLTAAGAIELARRELGLARVILPRELSCEQIRRLTGETEVPLEVFVHGALCISYGGQCLASLGLGGRSGNRGQCAQPCRLPYEIRVDGRKAEGAGRPYVLSPLDLAAWDRVGELYRIGVRAFKIEGRMKSAAYVAAATSVYRAALDAAAAGRPFEIEKRRKEDLAQSFSRGFSHGFLDGTDHGGLVDGRFPKKRGLRAGTVAGRTARGVLVALEEGAELRPGDGLVFDAGRPERDEQGGRAFEVLSRPGRVVEVRFGRGELNLSAVPEGSLVWKTDDPRLRSRLERELARRGPVRREALDVRARTSAGEGLTLTFRDGAGHGAEVSWPGPLQRAEKHPLTVELLREQLGRLGGTPFRLGSVEIEGSEPVLAPKSVLNDLRRRAVERLAALRSAGRVHPVSEPEALAAMRREISRASGRGAPELNVLVRTDEQLSAVLSWRPPDGLARPHLVCCELPEARSWATAVEHIRAAGLRAALAAPRIVEPGEEGTLQALADCASDAVLVRNLATLDFFLRRPAPPELLGDSSLNAVNELSAAELFRWRLASLAPGADLGPEDLRRLAERVPPARLEVVLHRHQPLFHMKHCLYAARPSRSRNCDNCPRPCRGGGLVLRDRKGAGHPVLADVLGRNTVYGAVPESTIGRAAELLALGFRRFRIEMLLEDAAGTAALLSAVAGELRRAAALPLTPRRRRLESPAP